MNQPIEKFLWESNAIEGVYDDESFRQALRAWNYINDCDQITRPVIWYTFAILMENHLSPHFWKWRKRPVWIGGKQAPHYSEIPSLMKSWVVQANRLEDPLKDHVKFEHIHPFIDGNGRMGRMLMNWQYTRMGEPVKIFEAEKRQDYYKLNTHHE